MKLNNFFNGKVLNEDYADIINLIFSIKYPIQASMLCGKDKKVMLEYWRKFAERHYINTPTWANHIFKFVGNL